MRGPDLFYNNWKDWVIEVWVIKVKIWCWAYILQLPSLDFTTSQILNYKIFKTQRSTFSL